MPSRKSRGADLEGGREGSGGEGKSGSREGVCIWEGGLEKKKPKKKRRKKINAVKAIFEGYQREGVGLGESVDREKGKNRHRKRPKSGPERVITTQTHYRKKKGDVVYGKSRKKGKATSIQKTNKTTGP